VPERILLVDDEPAIVAAATTGLERAGYAVRGTTDPHQAIDFAIHEPVDLVISDIIMPGLSGIELLRTVKQLYPEAAGVMITAHGTMELAIEALHAGASGFLLKPFTTTELRLSAEDALAKSRVLKENLRLHTLMPLYEASRALYAETDLTRLGAAICEQLARSMHAVQVSLYLAEPAGPSHWTFHTEAEYGPTEWPAPPNTDVLEWVAHTAEPLVLPEGGITNLPPELSGVPRPGVALHIPLRANGSLVGVARVKRSGSDAGFSDSEIEMASIQASQSALALHNSVLIRDMRNGYLDALGALANALEARDVETRGHTERLASHGVLVARQMALGGDTLESVRVGALVHDIGKIGVPDSILRKPGKLTPEEYEIIKRHPLIGDKILAPIPQLQAARAVILAHHERWDGTGYPYGIAGEDIPIAARIVSVVDAFDAITETRVYHTGESAVRALEELRRCRGAQFDPKVVDAFFEVLHVAQHALV